MNDYLVRGSYWDDGFTWRFLVPWVFWYDVPYGTHYCMGWLGFWVGVHWDRGDEL